MACRLPLALPSLGAGFSGLGAPYQLGALCAAGAACRGEKRNAHALPLLPAAGTAAAPPPRASPAAAPVTHCLWRGWRR
eukprot:2040963-Pyramimonas_sp.AAC.1